MCRGPLLDLRVRTCIRQDYVLVREVQLNEPNKPAWVRMDCRAVHLTILDQETIHIYGTDEGLVRGPGMWHSLCRQSPCT